MSQKSDDETNSTDGKGHSSEEEATSEQVGPKFSYIDFWPNCLEKGGLMKAPVFEDFSECFERANVFLKVNTDWEVITCETVERKQEADDEEIETEVMTYSEDSKRVQCFVNGLRLWVRVRDPELPAQRLGYLNFIPKAAPLVGKDKYPKFDTFSATVKEINSHLKSNPIEGKIVTIETRDIKYRGYWKEGSIDPDQSAWFQLGRECLYLFTIRIFYEVGESQNEEIGFKDFTPDKTGTEKVGLGRNLVATYETYPQLMAKSRAWLVNMQEKQEEEGLQKSRVTNIQTIERKMKRAASDVDVDATAFVDGEPSDKVFISSVRIAYVTAPNMEKQPYIDLKQRTVYATQLVEGRIAMKKYVTDSLKQTVVESLPWFNKHGYCRVLAIETLVAPVLKHVKEPHLNTCERFLTKHEWFQIYIRVFFDAFDDDQPDSDEEEEDENGDKSKSGDDKECSIQ